MKRGKLGAAAVALLCGAELFVAIAIGGAGVSSLFGLEGAVVAAALIAIVGIVLRQRRIRPGGAGE